MQTLKLRWRDITRSPSGRIMLALVLFALLISTGFVFYTYHTQLNASKCAQFGKLTALSTTLALQIDGDAYEAFGNSYPNRDQIASNDQDEYYAGISQLLRNAAAENQVATDIYSLFKDELGRFSFGISSAQTPYFRHPWEHYHPLYDLKYEEGGELGPYEDENGTWLSAFAPIKNTAGKTVGLLQVDQHFDEFMLAANQKIRAQIVIIIPILLVLIYIMLHIVQRLLNASDRLQNVLTQQRNQIEWKNKEIMSSITRAKTIQDAILPDISTLRNVFPEMFVLFQPRDVVSGDFFWSTEKNDSFYFAVADCTGHGVPGGFMSMIGHTTLNDVVHYMGAESPAEILTKLDEQLTTKLYDSDQRSTDGMDIAIIKYSKLTRQLEFSGAMRPLVLISDEKINVVPGSKYAIGGHTHREKIFENNVINAKPGDCIYLFSDGYSDQFGGESNKKYMSKKFTNFLEFAHSHHLEDQHHLLRYEFNLWRNDTDQIDDVLVAGLKMPEAA